MFFLSLVSGHNYSNLQYLNDISDLKFKNNTIIQKSVNLMN